MSPAGDYARAAVSRERPARRESNAGLERDQEKWAPVFRLLVEPNKHGLDQKAAGQMEADFAKKPIGTGPFVFAEYQP